MDVTKLPQYDMVPAAEFLQDYDFGAVLRAFKGSEGRDFQDRCREFIDRFVELILTQQAASSEFTSGLYCFCPELLLEGDDKHVFDLFNRLARCLERCGTISDIECKSAVEEFRTFVVDVRGRHAASGEVAESIPDVVSYLLGDYPFLARKNLCRVFELCCLVVLKPQQKLPDVDIDLSGCAVPYWTVTSCIRGVQSCVLSSNYKQNDDNLWFPTPENPGNEEEHTPIQRRILNEIRELMRKEQLDPTKDQESRNEFLNMFKWEGSQIEGDDRKQLEQTIVEYNDIFARHRLDIGINNKFKVKLTPKDERPIYTQSLPVPINLKEDLTVELALMHRYGIITTLPFSKYASPIFAQRKPNGKLRLLVDLRKINALISDDYINNNHPVSTLSDAAQHLAGKKLFCKLDCSQAYHCLQMADQRSIEMLAFNFASRTFAYKRLAQGLSRALSAFSSFMREYLDKVIKADQCAQYVDDIGIAANTVTYMDDTGCSPVSFEVYCVVPLYVSNRMTMFLFLHFVVFLVQASRWLLVLDFASSHFDRFVIFSFTQELFFSLLNYLIAIFQFFKYSLFFDTVFFEPFVMSLAILGGCICFAAVVFTGNNLV